MIKLNICIITACLMLTPLFAFSETPEEYKVKDSDLTLEGAKKNLDEIETALKDYRDFTDVVLNDEALRKLNDKQPATITINSDDLKNNSTRDWSVQNIGFVNWVIMVRGMLLKSDYVIKKQEYDLAKLRKNLSEKELSKLQTEMKKASDRYRQFLSRVVLVD